MLWPSCMEPKRCRPRSSSTGSAALRQLMWASSPRVSTKPISGQHSLNVKSHRSESEQVAYLHEHLRSGLQIGIRSTDQGRRITEQSQIFAAIGVAKIDGRSGIRD